MPSAKEMIVEFGLLIILIVGVCTVAPIACQSPDVAQKVLQDNGYSDIKITGYKFFKCGEDMFSTGFIAKNSSGKQVSGVVCGGFMKGNTIRFD